MKTLLLPLCGFIFGNIFQVSAQDLPQRLQQLFVEDSTDIQTLAIYPAETRALLLQASAHPDVLARISDAQLRSNERFKNLVSSYSKEEQQRIWSITRFEGLAAKMAILAPPSGDKLEDILKDYPDEAKEDARFIGSHYPQIPGKIAEQDRAFSEEYNTIVKTSVPDDQAAFLTLVKQPEALSMLNSNMKMTVRLGDLYKSDPAAVKYSLDTLALRLAAQKARDAEEWKKALKDDPEAAKELRDESGEYSKENGYDQRELTEKEILVVEHPVFLPYPYWCGYPWWHRDPYWYPYPYWYHTGFYFWHGEMVIWGPPSWYFLNWHFYHRPHFAHYPHISGVYLNYYYGPRRAASFNTMVVHNWVRSNKSLVPKEIFIRDKDQPERIREFGKQPQPFLDQRGNKPEPSQGKEHLQQNEIKQQPTPGKSEPVQPRDVKPKKQSPQPGVKPPVREKKEVPGNIRPPKQHREVKTVTPSPSHPVEKKSKPPRKSSSSGERK